MNRVEKRRVVLVHGLWMHSLVMLPLAWRLRRCGFDVACFSYRSVSRGIDANAARLAIFCAQWPDTELCLVGHSLGGIMILSALTAHPEIKVRRVVLLGVPYSSRIFSAIRMSRYRMGRAMIGQSIRDWLGRSLPPLPAGLEVGVVAGDISMGLGRILGPLPGVSDGVVCESETRIPGACDAVTLHVSHSGMLISPAVADATGRFLKEGHFARR
ncbi:MAG: alpha/beta fold hydrolase [Burkholderiales bacterium]